MSALYWWYVLNHCPVRYLMLQSCFNFYWGFVLFLLRLYYHFHHTLILDKMSCATGRDASTLYHNPCTILYTDQFSLTCMLHLFHQTYSMFALTKSSFSLHYGIVDQTLVFLLIWPLIKVIHVFYLSRCVFWHWCSWIPAVCKTHRRWSETSLFLLGQMFQLKSCHLYFIRCCWQLDIFPGKLGGHITLLTEDSNSFEKHVLVYNPFDDGQRRTIPL